jgi:hypothetical protein
MRSSTTIAALLLATAAVHADDKKYTLPDLRALVAQASWTEAVIHLADIPPAQRGADWQDVAASAAAGLLESVGGEDGTALAVIDSIDRDYPQLRKVARYARARTERGPRAVAGCLAQAHDYGPDLDACMVAGVRFVDNSGGDRALTIAVAKLGVDKASPANTLVLWKRVVGPKDTVACKEPALATAVIGGLDTAPEGSIAKDARAVMGTCWTEVAAAVEKAFDEHGNASSVHGNTCEILKAKKKLSSLQVKLCSK